MARVKIEEIIDDLSVEMRSAMRAAIDEVAPDAEIDPSELFRSFKRAVGRRCSIWETVPDGHVEMERKPRR